MVAEIANTRIDVYRGTTFDSFGDVLDTTNALWSDIPACLIEDAQTTQDPTSPTPRTIRVSKLVVAPQVGLLNTDRIFDRNTRNTYSVISVTNPPSLINVPSDTTAQLKRVTAETT